MDAAELSKTYQKRFDSKEQYRHAVWNVLINDFFQKYVPADATVLDLGCGFGEFINQVGARKKYAMDLNTDAEAKLNPDVAFLNQDCSAEWPLPDASLDIIFTSNFFEHLPNKDLLDKTLIQARRCLKPGGKIICMGPNIKYLPGLYWDFWDHYVALTELSLKEVFELKGYNIVDCIGRFLPYSMSLGSQPPIIFLRMFLKMPFFWPYFGKQFLVVAERPR